MISFDFCGPLWVNEGPGGWYFITVPEDISSDIHGSFIGLSPGFGSIPLEVTIGKTSWHTSIFYDTKVQVYLLPVKKEIRTKEALYVGQDIPVTLSIQSLP